MKCPDCEGKKEVFAHLNYGPERTGEWKMIQCFRCNGSGVVPDEMAEWINNGQVLRQMRIDAELSLRDMAKQTGIDIVTLSQSERGYINPSKAITAVYEALGEE
jgi:DNA-binding XRE family transcriptional regulator